VPSPSKTPNCNLWPRPSKDPQLPSTSPALGPDLKT
jgi:hypothetical protein